MTLSESANSPSASPFFFRVNDASCLGWIHTAAAPRRGLGVVLCRPIGYEASGAYGAYTHLAEQLALCGVDVLRFDYPGTGDSSGDDSQADRVQNWIDGIVCATQELVKLTGNSHVCLFGLRMGATLAAHAARRLGGVAKLVMWVPCASGRSFARELRAAAIHRERADHGGEVAASGGMESLGFFYSDQTLADLDALPGLPMDGPPSPHVLVLDRDDGPHSNKLIAALQATGVETTSAVVPGYALMMSEPRETRLDLETIHLVKDWLLKDLTVLMDGKTVELDRPTFYLDQGRPRQHQFEGLRETAVSFGTAPKLFGILCQPDQTPMASGCRDTAILLLNVGGNYRIGPNRIYVHIARELARMGCRTLRFDLAGLGDSRSESAFQWRHLYSKDSTLEVRSAIDFLSAQGCQKFYLLGICSGSFVAFQAALADPRVTGQILLNSRLLEWREANPDGPWQNSMTQPFKSVSFYRRQLFNWRIYKRIFQGDVDVAGITNRWRLLLSARLKRRFTSVFPGDSSVDGPLQKVKLLSRRGTQTLMIVNADDDGRDYLEFHFGRAGKYLKNEAMFQMIFVDGSDHTFSDKKGQESVISTVKAHIGVSELIGPGLAQ